MPRTSKLVLAVLAACILISSAVAVLAAGAYSHYYIARQAARSIGNDPTASADLSEALQDSDALNAFCCGAVSPDLSSINDKAHHNSTTQIPMKLIELANRRLRAARQIPANDPDKNERMRHANRDLAFAYGWMSHVAADLSVHPIVNAMVGDAYEFVDLGGKGFHAAQEVQLDYFVDKTIRKPGEKIDYDIPYDLLSAASGVSAASLRASAVVIRTKLAAGISWQNAVDVDFETLGRRWGGVIDQIVSDTDKYVTVPTLMKDWDIDVGQISTTDFEKLRDGVIEANGGTLPSNWGANYIDWFNRTRGIKPADMRAALVALIHNKPLPSESDDLLFGDDVAAGIDGSTDLSVHPAPARESVPGVVVKRTDTYGNLKVWVNGAEVAMNSECSSKGSSVLSIKVMCSDPRRFDWKKTFPPRNITVVKATPYAYRYKLPNPLSVMETEWTVSDEHFDYWTSSPTTVLEQAKGGFSTSGANPAVKNDLFEWTVPMPRTSSRGGQDVYTIYIEGSLSYKVIDYLSDGTTQRHSNATFGSSETAEFKITVPTKG